tara:strand:- start:86 stop:652 length:567 start_codon:yes stop_codon:yes gene_type:complete
MAIVINGSGTVTGLAVGGLPDGTVDSGTIATGTIVNADINASAAIAGTKLANTGKVLQVVEADSGSSTTINTTTYAAITGASVTITPTSATSRIIIDFSCGAYCNGSSTGIGLQIKRGAIAVRDMGRYAYSGNSGFVPLPISITCLDSPATTSATTYTVEAKIGTNGLEVNNGGGTKPLIIRATEIGA